MGKKNEHRFRLSDTCYFDMASNTIVDIAHGVPVNYSPITGVERTVMRELILAYPNPVSKEQLCRLIGGTCDESDVRRIINKLKKRHVLLGAWIPRARQGEYCLQEPVIPADPKPAAHISAKSPACVLKSTGICVRPCFVHEAREDVFCALDEAFRENHVVFLQGIGGIGKSETAKHWGIQKKKEGVYDSVVFAQLNSEANNSNIQSLITDDAVFVVSGAFSNRDDTETAEAYFRRKLAKIKQITDERTLIIIDNYDVDDPQMAELFTGTYHLLITTRNMQRGVDFPIISVREIENTEYLKRIIFKNLSGERDDIRWDDPYIENLFSLVSNHTLTVEIIAKALVNSVDTPESLCRKIGQREQHALIRNMDGMVERNFSEEALTPFACIQILFNLSRLEKDQDFAYKSQVLVFLAAMPTRGIELSLFQKWSDNRIIRAKNSLVRKSWLRQDSVNSTTLLSMHPLIREIVWYELKPSVRDCAMITERMRHNEGLYVDSLYHQTKVIKDQYERVALSLLSAFPVGDLSDFEFYTKIQTIINSCANAEKALELAYRLKEVLEQANETDTYRYAYICHRIGSVYASLLYREREKGSAYFLAAEKLMRSTARTNEEKMQLALLYREMASTDCNDGYLFKPDNAISTETIEDWLNKGQAIVQGLRESGYTNTNLDIYWGTACVWRCKLEIYRGNLKLASEVIETAEKEFARYGYINKLDKASVEACKALICSVSGNHAQAISHREKALEIFLDGFGEYHRVSVENAINLAEAYRKNGQSAEAIEILVRYKKIAQEMYGEGSALEKDISSRLKMLI